MNDLPKLREKEARCLGGLQCRGFDTYGMWEKWAGAPKGVQMKMICKGSGVSHKNRLKSCSDLRR